MKWWNGERMGTSFALDTETEMISHASMTPRLVISTASDGQSAYLIKNEDLLSFLTFNVHATLIMHNAVFDLAVISKYLNSKTIYLRAEDDQLWDTRIMYQLIKLAESGISPQKNSLALVSKEYLGIELDKDAAVRCNFGQFLNCHGRVDYDKIPTEFLEYALKDAEITFKLWKEELYPRLCFLEKDHGVEGTGLSHKIQLLGAIALDDIQKNGIGFNLAGKETRLAALEQELKEHKDRLAAHGWERGKKGIKKIFTEITEGLGINLPKTASGQTATDADTLAEYVEKHPFIESYVKFHELEKLGTFIREIETDRLHPRYNLLMNTGRTSSFGPNIQQLPRSGGVRELFIPSEGNVFLDIDYAALELCTLAQHLYREFHDTAMMDAINAGKDLHKVTASQIYGIEETAVDKGQRQFAKIANFGYPANMSPDTFVDYCKGYGVKVTSHEATDLKKLWASTIPSIKRFWNVGSKDTNVLVTGRVRAKCSYTAYLNTFFQGLAADGAKLAMYLLWKEGFKIVAFVHDQVLIEVPESKAEELLPIAEGLLIRGMSFVVPDVKISVEGKITKTFSK
jgi:DNA polymerase I-like protein with 3'-5' exonuclease and polymerase domains